MLFDENYLDLIVNNLLSNAFKYTEVGESITVKLCKEDNNLILQVVDTGIGIPKEKQKRFSSVSIKWKTDAKAAALVFRWSKDWLSYITGGLSYKAK